MSDQSPSTSSPEVLQDDDHILAHNVDEEPVEANRRLFSGGLLKLVTVLTIAYSSFHLFTLNVAPIESWSYRIIHVAGALFLGFMLYAGARFVQAEDDDSRHCIRFIRRLPFTIFFRKVPAELTWRLRRGISVGP